jgi:SAM-dependent methyltransferase
MNRRRRLATIALLVSLAAAGCQSWRGPGFRADGPEMPRLRHALTLAPGMSVADVGAGGGELTVALAAEIGPGGRVYATDIDPDALEQIRARVVAAELGNVTILPARARETGLPTGCCDAVVLRRVYHHLSDPAATNLDLVKVMEDWPGRGLLKSYCAIFRKPE